MATRANLSDLIEALQILLKYGDPKYPTHAEHDVIFFKTDHRAVSEEDKVKLHELGISVGTEGGEECFQSYRWASG